MVKVLNGTILGTQVAESILAGAGADLIYGFLGADTIDGGEGHDILYITGSSADLNFAADTQLTRVEEVSANLAHGGVTIDLSHQSEGFVLTGSAYRDVLTGGLGKNKIDAGDGDDTIYGFGAYDTLDGGSGADTLVLNSSIANATDTQLSNIESIIASGAANGLTINLGHQLERFYLIGSGFNDTITGGSNADVINTGAGDDKIYDFIGNDYLNGGDGVDTLYLTRTSVYLNAALDVQLTNVETVSAATAASGVNIDLSGQSEGFTIIGSDQADYLKGGAQADTFIGSSGVDTLDGGFGNDTLLISFDYNNITNAQLTNIESISAASAIKGLVINLGAQNERVNITGSGYSDTITGSIGIDVIVAGAGDDVIKGFASADTIDGGTGADTLILTATSANLNTATDAQLTNVEAISARETATPININLSAQTESFMISGGNYSDTLTGGAGDDTFYGFNGSDNIDGRNGTDTLVILVTSATLNGASDAQLANVEAISALNATLGVTILMMNQSEGFVFTGSSLADQLVGTSQADVFIGFKGADTIDGGASTDTIKLTQTSLDLNNSSNAQLSNVEAISALDAASGVTISMINQSEGFIFTGSNFADQLTGTSQADFFNEFKGADTIDGGAGTDTIKLTQTSLDLNSASNAQLVNIEKVSATTAHDGDASAPRGVTIDLTNQTERIDITGSAYSDTITGSTGINVIIAGAGDDVINGFISADTIDGGVGDDTLVLTATSTNLNTATDTQLTNVESISAIGAAAAVNINLSTQTEGFKVTGGNYSNTLFGGSGADTLFGGSGADTFYGFSGSDNIDGRNGTDTLVILATSASLNGASDAQLTNVEAISAVNAPSGVTISMINQSEGFNFTGSNFADQLVGTTQADFFTEFKGADTIDGGASIDTIKLTATSLDLNKASNAQVVNIEKVSAATALAGVTIDLTNQTERIDITGSAFNDTIIGGSGVNYLTGGLGVDHFVFNAPASSTGIDTLVDFTPAEDVLDFNHTTFTSLGAVGSLQAIKFWSSATDVAAHSATDRLIYNTTTSTLYYDEDGLGGAGAIQIAHFSNHEALKDTDFIII